MERWRALSLVFVVLLVNGGVKGFLYRARLQQISLIGTTLTAANRDEDDRFGGTPLGFEDELQPRIKVKSLDEIQQAAENERQSSSNQQQAQLSSSFSSRPNPATPSKSFGSFNFEEMYRKIGGSTPSTPAQQKSKEDVSDVNPLDAFLNAILPLCICFAASRASTYLASHFAVNLLESELYPVQRFAVLSRNLIVGIFTLAAGFSGVVGLGLIALGFAALYSKLKGNSGSTQETENEDKS